VGIDLREILNFCYVTFLYTEKQYDELKKLYFAIGSREEVIDPLEGSVCGGISQANPQYMCVKSAWRQSYKLLIHDKVYVIGTCAC
jgi:hypothetical protein